MEYLGFSLPFFFAIILNFLILLFFLSWVPLSIYALVQLRYPRISEVARVLWAALIISVPYLGAIAFLIVRPDEEFDEPY